MANYNKSLLLKEAAKIGLLPVDTPLPKMPGWTSDHVKSGRDWMGRSPFLEKSLDSYLLKKKIKRGN